MGNGTKKPPMLEDTEGNSGRGEDQPTICTRSLNRTHPRVYIVSRAKDTKMPAREGVS